MLAVVALAGAHGGPVTLILAGLAVSSIATALISLALNLSQNPFASVEMVFWMMGSLADRSLTQVWLAAPLMLAGIGLLLLLGRALDALTLGEDAARSLGIDLAPHAAAIVVAGTALSVGAATAVTGIIGFVGLIVPHVLRPFAGHRPGLLLPASMLGGAIMLLRRRRGAAAGAAVGGAADRRAHGADRRAVLRVAGAQDARRSWRHEDRGARAARQRSGRATVLARPRLRRAAGRGHGRHRPQRRRQDRRCCARSPGC